MAASKSGGSKGGGGKAGGGGGRSGPPKTIHTVPNPDGKGWINKSGGGVESKHRKKENAQEKGRDIAIEKGLEHKIHGLDGQIQQSNSYGNDPNPPKDKK